jgi:hypothetical protein
MKDREGEREKKEREGGGGNTLSMPRLPARPLI